MPIEPLQTDEKRSNPQRVRDIDTVLMMGCSTFGVFSVISLALFVVPFLMFQDLYRFGQLLETSAAGIVGGSILAVFGARRFGIPGGSGCLAGALASAIFLSLRLEQVFLRGEAQLQFQPDYPRAAIWLVPLAWVVWIAIVGLASLRIPDNPTV